MGIFSENKKSDFDAWLASRHRKGKFWRFVYALSTVVGIIVLILLLLNIINSAFGYAAIENEIDPVDLEINGYSIEVLHKDDLVSTLPIPIPKGG